MQGQTKERWLELCELVAKEQDPNRFLELIQELNRVLQEKEERMKRKAAV